MILYNLKKDKLNEIPIDQFKLEKDIQKIVEQNIEEIFNLKFVCSEFSIRNQRFD